MVCLGRELFTCARSQSAYDFATIIDCLSRASSMLDEAKVRHVIVRVLEAKHYPALILSFQLRLKSNVTQDALDILAGGSHLVNGRDVLNHERHFRQKLGNGAKLHRKV